MQFACLDSIGKPLGYMCVKTHLTLGLGCENNLSHDQLVQNCIRSYPKAVKIASTVLKR